ncbi:MAG: hypothetical protein H6912_02090 [Kordiimonadaceae bacterium]|nr:hypothetical protein [Kordiimonadaceae bacterium]
MPITDMAMAIRMLRAIRKRIIMLKMPKEKSRHRKLRKGRMKRMMNSKARDQKTVKVEMKTGKMNL